VRTFPRIKFERSKRETLFGAQHEVDFNGTFN